MNLFVTIQLGVTPHDWMAEQNVWAPMSNIMLNMTRDYALYRISPFNARYFIDQSIVNIVALHMQSSNKTCRFYAANVHWRSHLKNVLFVVNASVRVPAWCNAVQVSAFGTLAGNLTNATFIGSINMTYEALARPNVTAAPIAMFVAKSAVLTQINNVTTNLLKIYGNKTLIPSKGDLFGQSLTNNITYNTTAPNINLTTFEVHAEYATLYKYQSVFLLNAPLLYKQPDNDRHQQMLGQQLKTQVQNNQYVVGADTYYFENDNRTLVYTNDLEKSYWAVYASEFRTTLYVNWTALYDFTDELDVNDINITLNNATNNFNRLMRYQRQAVIQCEGNQALFFDTGNSSSQYYCQDRSNSAGYFRLRPNLFVKVCPPGFTTINDSCYAGGDAFAQVGANVTLESVDCNSSLFASDSISNDPCINTTCPSDTFTFGKGCYDTCPTGTLIDNVNKTCTSPGPNDCASGELFVYTYRYYGNSGYCLDESLCPPQYVLNNQTCQSDCGYSLRNTLLNNRSCQPDAECPSASIQNLINSSSSRLIKALKNSTNDTFTTYNACVTLCGPNTFDNGGKCDPQCSFERFYLQMNSSCEECLTDYDGGLYWVRSEIRCNSTCASSFYNQSIEQDRHHMICEEINTTHCRRWHFNTTFNHYRICILTATCPAAYPLTVDDGNGSFQCVDECRFRDGHYVYEENGVTSCKLECPSQFYEVLNATAARCIECLPPKVNEFNTSVSTTQKQCADYCYQINRSTRFTIDGLCTEQCNSPQRELINYDRLICGIACDFYLKDIIVDPPTAGVCAVSCALYVFTHTNKKLCVDSCPEDLEPINGQCRVTEQQFNLYIIAGVLAFVVLATIVITSIVVHRKRQLQRAITNKKQLKTIMNTESQKEVQKQRRTFKIQTMKSLFAGEQELGSSEVQEEKLQKNLTQIEIQKLAEMKQGQTLLLAAEEELHQTQQKISSLSSEIKRLQNTQKQLLK